MIARARESSLKLRSLRTALAQRIASSLVKARLIALTCSLSAPTLCMSLSICWELSNKARPYETPAWTSRATRSDASRYTCMYSTELPVSACSVTCTQKRKDTAEHTCQACGGAVCAQMREGALAGR